MKVLKYSLFVLLLGFSNWAYSQCFCSATILPVNDCCGELQVFFDVNCDPTAVYTQITIDPTFAPPFSGKVESVTFSVPGFTSSIDPVTGIATLTYSGNIASIQPLGTTFAIGTVCFKDAPGPVVTSNISVANPSNGLECGDVAETPINCPPPGDWAKIYGDTLDNRPSKVKAFTDGVYVAGYVDLNGSLYGTMSKFNIQTGALVWHCRLDFPCRISDFEYDPINDELILVGAEGQIGPGVQVISADRSFIIKVDDNGNPGLRKLYDYPGREGLTRIVRHHNPKDADYPYYILGRKNPVNNAPSAFDLTMLYNIDENLNVNDIWYYDAGAEIEAYRLLVPLDDGDLFIGGNSSDFGAGTTNDGILLDIDGANGSVNGTVAYPGVIDLYDGVDLGIGEVALAGHDFGADMGLVYIIDRSTYVVTDGLRFPDVSLFTEIGIDGQNGDLYTLGKRKSGADRYHVMHRLSYINGIAGFVLGNVYFRYLFDGESAFDEPHFSVTPTHDAIFYADARRDSPLGFGDYDMLVGSFNLDFDEECMDNFPQLGAAYLIGDLSFPVNDLNQPEPPSFLQFACVPVDYACEEFCAPPPACTADFTWDSECCILNLQGIATGVGPFIYEWDIDCDNPFAPDATGQNPSLGNLSLGSHQVCLTITDATGCSASVQKTVTVVGDITPPVFNCPPDQTIPTDPGLCTAFYQPTITATDDCTDNLIFNCTLTGATTGTLPNTNIFNKGITTVTCLTEDAKGNIADCTFTVTVVDQEPPTISCPSPVTASVAACAGGANVNFPAPTVGDNCPMVTWTCSHQSGDFFPCGTTIVICTATDMAGNQTDCSFPVTVECECAEVGGETITCTNVDDQFAFSVSVIDLTGSGTNGCVVNVSSPQSGITISGVTVTGSGPGYTISGLIDVAAPPMPNTILIVVDVTCVCPNGDVHDCSFPISLNTPCCKEISVDPLEVCENGPDIQIPLIGCNTLYDVQQVRWYVADAPCPPTSWGPPIQITNGCAPLTLSPRYHNGDVCVYAEVDMGPGAGPCTMLTSNVATISLCSPISCSLNDTAFCWVGTPITPSPLTVTLNPAVPDCSYQIDWYDPNGNLIPGATGQTTYQPPALSFTAPSTDCAQSYTYTVVVTGLCGTSSCTSTIRLDNDDAPNGTLDLLPPDVNPLCYGEDAVLEYTPECAGTPEMWDWFIRPDVQPTYTPLPSNGTQNPLYFTNRLYEDTWIKVEKTNGVCAPDEIEFFLDIIEPVTINNFTADFAPICNPTSVDMMVDFMPTPAPAGCTYTVHWYHGSNLVHTSIQTTSPSMYTYTPPAGVGLGGNYYCIIENACCPGRAKSNVVVKEPPMEVYATGPCYRCNCDTITLNGIVRYPIPGFTCTYQWYDNGLPIPGATNTTLVVDTCRTGPFLFEVTCTDGFTTCVQSDAYNLLQCGTCDPSICFSSTFEYVKLNSKVYPSPTSDIVYLELDDPVSFELIEVFDIKGQSVIQLFGERYGTQFMLDLSNLPVGLYTVKAISTDAELLVQKIIKQ